jgi:hypothetical protein
MEITSSKELVLPIPLFAMEQLAIGTGRDGTVFEIIAGLDEKLVEQLKQYSLDESDVELQENTSDKKRFGEGSYPEWYAKGRVPFVLIEKNSGTLAAISWLGPKPLGQKSMKYLSDDEISKEKTMDAGEWHTISYRCYGQFRGKGLMRSFVQFTIDAYMQKYPNGKLWAIINTKNMASDALAEKLGFKAQMEVSHPEDNLLVMTRE